MHQKRSAQLIGTSRGKSMQGSFFPKRLLNMGKINSLNARFLTKMLFTCLPCFFAKICRSISMTAWINFFIHENNYKFIHEFMEMYHRHFVDEHKISLKLWKQAWVQFRQHFFLPLITPYKAVPLSWLKFLSLKGLPDLSRNPCSGEAILLKFPNAKKCDMCCVRGTDLPNL